MASVSVYNKEGKEVEKIDLNDSVFAAPVNEHLVHMAVVLQLANVREHRKLRHVLKFVAVVENHGDRKELVMLDRVPSVLHSGQAAALCSHRFREIILSK